MNNKKLVSAILCVLSVASLFSGCQAAPNTAVVVGKNDGVFESALNSSAEPVEDANTETFSYTNTFTSTDGKIEFNINDNSIEYSGNPMPVLRVTPQSYSADYRHQYGITSGALSMTYIGTRSAGVCKGGHPPLLCFLWAYPFL